jgi:Ni2+-binding GTPase involved in maturation of urease and hydrogenase
MSKLAKDRPFIEIKVSGATGAGKSAVVQLIAKALQDAGMQVSALTLDHDFRTPKRHQRAIESIAAKGALVGIEEYVPACYSNTITDGHQWVRHLDDMMTNGSGVCHTFLEAGGPNAPTAPEDPIAAYDRAMKVI